MNTQHKLLSSCPVSCFADEIAESLDRQIEVLSRLGISYVELRSADGINVSDFTMNFAKEVKKKLDQANIRISAIGSPIGKIGIDDDFDAHLQKLSHTEQMADIFETPYIRMFSFYIRKTMLRQTAAPRCFSGWRRWLQRLRITISPCCMKMKKVFTATTRPAAST